MAKKKDEPKIVLERTYNIPLRKEWLKVAKYRRAKKAVKAVKEFLMKHMKASEVKVGKYLNLELWKHGIKNPPHHIKVNVTKDDKGLVKAELVGAPIEKEPEKKKKKPETAADKVKSMLDKTKKPEEKKEEKSETTEEKVKKMVEKTKKHEEGEPSAEELLKGVEDKKNISKGEFKKEEAIDKKALGKESNRERVN